jgi:4-hydroxy-3-polyprenylbenzoate decarboxylase
LLQVLSRQAYPVHLTISGSGAAVIKQELGLHLNVLQPDLLALLNCRWPWQQGIRGGDSGLAEEYEEYSDQHIVYHHPENFMTPIASGSFLTAGMIVCPCSGSTLSGIARAAAGNLVQRAAEVHLKERRKLVIVPRETPVSTLQIENMLRVSQAGGVVLPAMPGWYHGVHSLDDLIDFVVARILDQFDLGEGLMHRWGADVPQGVDG